MEQQKDIIQKDIETKGHNVYVARNTDLPLSQKMNEDKPEKNINDKLSLILAKAEKLATATYMVTDFIPGTDPIRTKIKECSLDFLSDIYATNSASYSERVFLYRKTISTIEKICGLLGVASSVGFVSGMNYSILRTEYCNLKMLLNLLDEIKGSAGSALTFKEEFFATDNMISGPIGPEDFKTEDTAGYKGQNIIKDKTNNHLSVTTKLKLESPKISSLVQKDTRMEESKGNRRENILKVLKRKKDVTIKDIFEVIQGCSEKTIQRELLSMVASGVLKKEGEKRWSRYSLN